MCIMLSLHIYNVLVESITLASCCSAYFAHHDVFNLTFELLNVFFKRVRLPSIIAEVVELMHRVNAFETNLMS